MLQVSGEKKPCCREARNLQLVFSNLAGLTVRQCRVCTCKHYEAVARPGVLFAKTPAA